MGDKRMMKVWLATAPPPLCILAAHPLIAAQEQFPPLPLCLQT